MTVFDGYRCQDWTFEIREPGSEGLIMLGPNLVDAKDPAREVGGALSIDVCMITNNEYFRHTDLAEAPLEDRTRAIVAMLIARNLHEIAEWLCLDDEPVFAAHKSDDEWYVVGKTAWEAAGRMLREHPR